MGLAIRFGLVWVRRSAFGDGGKSTGILGHVRRVVGYCYSVGVILLDDGGSLFLLLRDQKDYLERQLYLSPSAPEFQNAFT